MSLETTTAGRVFVASAPTVGSKLTRNTSPRLIKAIGYDSLKFLVGSADLRRGLFVFGCKPFGSSLLKETLYGLGDKPASLSGLHIPRKLCKQLLRETDIDTSSTHCVSLLCIL